MLLVFFSNTDWLHYASFFKFTSSYLFKLRKIRILVCSNISWIACFLSTTCNKVANVDPGMKILDNQEKRKKLNEDVHFRNLKNQLLTLFNINKHEMNPIKTCLSNDQVGKKTKILTFCFGASLHQRADVLGDTEKRRCQYISFVDSGQHSLKDLVVRALHAQDSRSQGRNK